MGKIRYYNFLYRLCCNYIAFTRNLNWLNLLVHCLPGSKINTGFQTCLYHCHIMADFQLCCVRAHCSFLSSKKIQTTSQKTTQGTSLTLKGDGWFRLSPMGMWRLLITLSKEGFFFLIEKSCYDALYQVLMMHSLSRSSSPSSSYRSSLSSCSCSFCSLAILLISCSLAIDILAIDHPSFVIPSDKSEKIKTRKLLHNCLFL